MKPSRFDRPPYKRSTIGTINYAPPIHRFPYVIWALNASYRWTPLHFLSSSFGAKCANVATMRTFGFPTPTIPNGFGVPFYFYDEFMKHNDFYNQRKWWPTLCSSMTSISKAALRILEKISKPQACPNGCWFLQSMHDAFPVGTAVGVVQAPTMKTYGFGAGLYTSKTQHTDEGHISKSIKQVYASMWNFRAFEERDFYRVDHFVAAMGVLCHQILMMKNNGVGVTIDPIYDTDSTFYLNTQIGESLITNPDPNCSWRNTVFEDTGVMDTWCWDCLILRSKDSWWWRTITWTPCVNTWVSFTMSLKDCTALRVWMGSVWTLNT